MANAAVREMIAATMALVNSLHAAVNALQVQMLDLMGLRVEMDRLRAQAAAATERADALALEVASLWPLVRQAAAESKSQDVRIADLEALEGYGWRAPPVYEPKVPPPALPSVPELFSQESSGSLPLSYDTPESPDQQTLRSSYGTC